MPHNNFLMNLRDIKFVIKEWLPMDKLLSLDAYKDYYAIDDIDNFLDVNYKVCRDVMCPANKDADEIGATFVGGEEHAVVTPDSFKNVYKTVMDAELGPQFGFRGEGKIPLAWYAPILEMQSAASPAIVMFWCLTQGATTVLQDYGTQKQKDMFLPKMFTGEWGGTMGLTEPGAGSEVGAVQSKAFPTDTPGLYKLKGQKCFITSGDHDLAENIIHLMLAKTPGAKEGTAGISLFIVPKFWVNEDGSMGAWNDVTSVGIEHKMGIHGSSTLTLAMGENDNCYGWIVGEKEPVDGRGVGMSQMFAYMNEERLNTGLFTLGCITSAYYAALDYTKIRVQSKHSTNPKGPMGCPAPNLMEVSISAALATPSIRAYIPSFNMGISKRFTTKPGASLISTGALPIFSDSSLMVSKVAWLVLAPRIISTSFIAGTGLKKCIPITLSALPVAAAISVTLNAEVLVARIHSGLHIASSSLKMLFLISITSRAASITRSHSAAAAMSTVPEIRPIIAALSSALILPLSTFLPRSLSIPAIPRSTNSCLISLTITSKPA
jgi:alkylation response protein AidB-like acyl-CoA dehydrogenase